MKSDRRPSGRTAARAGHTDHASSPGGSRKRRTVLVTHFQLANRPGPWMERLAGAGFDVVFNPLGRVLTEEELIARLPGVYATIASSEPYNDRVFASAPDLRIVARWGVGYDRIDIDAATRHDVAIVMAFGANHEAVADTALAMMASLANDLRQYHRRVARGGWGSRYHMGLHRKTVGIVGLGRIGRAVARRCQGFDMRVLGVDPALDRARAAALGVELVPLPELLRESDFVTLHCPRTPDTLNLINAETLALMKPGAYLVNTARGGLVDEAALADALTGGRLAGAGLDVFAREPPVDSPLLGLDNVALMPHSAGASTDATDAVTERCIDNILTLAAGGDPGDRRVLNPSVIKPRPR
jgi:phosphoglycerate dehydrogenase-like enzyme